MKLGISRVEAIKIVRISLSSLLAILLADLLGLKYSATAGIIALLSIQDTKRETVGGVIRRCISYVAAVVLSWVIFHFVGFHAYSYGIFLLIFTAASYRIGWQDVLSTSAVVTTHFLTEAHYGWDVVGNELALLMIGIGMAVMMNLLLTPLRRSDIKELRQNMEDVEKRMRVILNNMAAYTQRIDSTDLDGEDLKHLEHFLEEARKRAWHSENNSKNADSEYYLDYMDMRMAQCQTLREMHNHLHRLAYIPQHAGEVAKFMRHMADHIHERDNADRLIAELHELMRLHKSIPLPTTRLQVDDYAILYDVLNEMEFFLERKKSFVEGMTEEQGVRYWAEQ